MHIIRTRRDFLSSLSVVGATRVLGARGSPLRGAAGTTGPAAPLSSNICLRLRISPEDLLRAEGFTDIRYVPVREFTSRTGWHAARSTSASPRGVGRLSADAGVPVTAMAGVHSGCYELFAHDPVRTIGDLKGRSVGIQTLSSSGHLYVAIMAAHVGLDPHEDINWVTSPTGNAMELFAEGKVDAFLGFPPRQELRARKLVG